LRREAKDEGTPELKAKAKRGLTKEPLDILLASGLIEEWHHQQGMRFRWLYTLKFGLAVPCGFDPSGREARVPSPERDTWWQARREAEYAAQVDALCRCGAKRAVFELCIYRRWPLWLMEHQWGGKSQLSGEARRELALLRGGLAGIGKAQPSESSGKAIKAVAGA
jgi:hypothetical protein